MEAPIHRIVLTGGPCAGKSTALVRVGAWLAERGFQVFRVPEASTLLLSGGISVADQPLEALRTFQQGIVEVQLALERSFFAFAKASGRASILLLDRGVPDGAAYLPEASWLELLTQLGLEHAVIRKERYDAVIHLMSAAIGAEAHYGVVTNAVRYETLEEARLVDERLRQAWLGHPRLSIIDNATDFETKIQRVILAISEVIGATKYEHEALATDMGSVRR